MKDQPAIHDFGLSLEDERRLRRLDSIAGNNEIGYSWLDRSLPKGRGCLSELLCGLLFWTLLWPFCLIGLLATPFIQLGASIKRSLDPKAKQWDAYRAALHDRERGKAEFWTKLSGLAFENQLAQLYRDLGYDATITAASGDKGIDIILRLDGRKTIVQCKQHSRPVGPAIARELLGALAASDADDAILACTAGFTPGVHSFVREHPIELLDLSRILALQEKAMSNKAVCLASTTPRVQATFDPQPSKPGRRRAPGQV